MVSIKHIVWFVEKKEAVPLIECSSLSMQPSGMCYIVNIAFLKAVIPCRFAFIHHRPKCLWLMNISKQRGLPVTWFSPFNKH